MQPGAPAPTGRAGWIVAACATAAIAVYILATGIAGVSVDIRERDSAILVFGALAICVAALAGWRRAMARADAAVDALERERAQARQAATELRDISVARDRALV